MKKTVQVIMLRRKTDEPEIGSLVKLRDKLYLFEPDFNFRSTLPQHLYFISNEEIKEGDYYIWNAQLCKEGDEDTVHYPSFRVIATTDKSLGLPIIPEAFVQEYVRNKGEMKGVVWDAEEERPYWKDFAYYGENTFIQDKEVSIEPKQTVEEAAMEYEPSKDIAIDFTADEIRKAFIDGANWYKANSYSI